MAALQTEVDDLRIKYQSLVRETEGERGRKDEEVEKVTAKSLHTPIVHNISTIYYILISVVLNFL